MSSKGSLTPNFEYYTYNPLIYQGWKTPKEFRTNELLPQPQTSL